MRIIEGIVAKVSILWPRRELVDRFPFDDRLIGGQSPSVERWRQQLALRAVPVTGQREHRIRSHDSAEIGVGRVGDVGGGLEQLANMAGITDDDHASEDGQIDREGRPVDGGAGSAARSCGWPTPTHLGRPAGRGVRVAASRQRSTPAINGGHGAAMIAGRDVESMHGKRRFLQLLAGRSRRPLQHAHRTRCQHLAEVTGVQCTLIDVKRRLAAVAGIREHVVDDQRPADVHPLGPSRRSRAAPPPRCGRRQ